MSNTVKGDGQPLVPQKGSRGIDIVFKDIHYSVWDSKNRSWKHILKGVSGEIRSGQCLAIMGASGAGKTTLLNIISGRIQKNSSNKLSGQILFNGVERDPASIAYISGYVQQQDILNELLTVKETLEFGAKLKMNVPPEKRRKRVNHMISEFKLEGTENTYIGGPSFKGVSGGERKRVNICLELIADPPILFLDEPTSGLDSYTSEVVINKLNQLAKDYNKTIVYVIHQPSSDIFRKMDKLTLLLAGKLVYQGKSGSVAVDYFSSIGFECDQNTNPADYFMYILQSKVEGLEKFLTSNYDKRPEMGKITSTNTDKIDFNSAKFPGVFTQFSCLLGRALKLTLRNPAQTIIRFVQVVILAIVFVCIYFDLDDDPKSVSGIYNRNGALFFMGAANFIPALMSQLIAFPIERAVFVKEYQAKYYYILPYYLSKSLIEVPFSLIFPMLFTVLTYFLVGFNTDSIERFFQQMLVSVLLTLASTALGINIGCIFNDVSVALAITPLIFMPMMLFSGFYVNSDSISVWLKWIEYASPFRYSFEAYVYNEFEDT